MTDMVHDVFGSRQGSSTAADGEEFSSTQIKIVTAGFGGAGCNIVNRLLKVGVKGTEFVAVNTDAQHFKIIDERIKKVLIGRTLTKGLGAGGDPAMGEKAAEVDRQSLEGVFADTQLVFLCCGMGGGTGTGAITVAAKIAKEQGAIVVAMVTYPFDLERVRKVKAEEGIQKLRKFADSVIILDNNRLVKLVPNLPMNDAFALADEVLAKAIGGLVWTITQPSLINIDFADVRAIMGNGGVGFIAVGSGRGANKVDAAAEGVLKNKLLDVDFEGADGAIIHISGGASMTIGDAIRSGEIITERMDPNSNVKWGARLMPGYEDQIEIVAIVCGVKGSSIVGHLDTERKSLPYGDLEMVG
ncbi:MAG: cell division protein FtsZ [Candidatus Micrarchaeaceae archaeon]|jgi:cell division protein FtsZ|nr:cell division protein FtsZ [Candidatus Micrarchaeota archaeon]HII10276.1 cell division protein FtsZ [Candidatus Micrarchaeota archaeon]